MSATRQPITKADEYWAARVAELNRETGSADTRHFFRRLYGDWFVGLSDT